MSAPMKPTAAPVEREGAPGIFETPSVSLADYDGRQPNMARARAYRLERVRQQLRELDVAGAVLFDPINIRYATGSRHVQVWTMHNPARYAFVATDGPVILFDWPKAQHLNDWIEIIDEVRPARAWFFYFAGPRMAERAQEWADEIADLVGEHGGGNRRIVMDRCEMLGVSLLDALGVEVLDGMGPMEFAREIKCQDELVMMGHAISVCEAAMARMRSALEPGMTENELWAILNHVNAAKGGEWIETKLLNSGGRTNPWYQEASDKLIRAGELVSFDTDLIGPFGMCADISRTYFCGPGRPTDAQRRIYRLAWEQIHHNIACLAPGKTFREIAFDAWVIPPSCDKNRYNTLYHGVGLCDEWPRIFHRDLFDDLGTDGVLEPGMALCVESYIGEEDGHEGVKLEQQVLITDTGRRPALDVPLRGGSPRARGLVVAHEPRDEGLDAALHDGLHLVRVDHLAGEDAGPEGPRLDERDQLLAGLVGILRLQGAGRHGGTHEVPERRHLLGAGIHLRRQVGVPDGLAERHAHHAHESLGAQQPSLGPGELQELGLDGGRPGS